MSNKLTKTEKEEILEDIMDYRFKKECDQLVQENREILEELYELKYGKEIEQMYSLPEGWLPEIDEFRVACKGDVDRLPFSGAWHHLFYVPKTSSLIKPVRKRVPNKDVHRVLLSIIGGDKYAEMLNDQQNKCKDFQQQYVRARNHAWAILNSVSTRKRLGEVWPEIKQFIPEEDSAPKLPVDVTSLNKELGLPPEKKAKVNA